MTCRELLQKLNCKIQTDAEFDGSEIQMTNIYDRGEFSVARIIVPVEGQLQVMEVQVKTLAKWEGLKISQGAEHLVP